MRPLSTAVRLVILLPPCMAHTLCRGKKEKNILALKILTLPPLPFPSSPPCSPMYKLFLSSHVWNPQGGRTVLGWKPSDHTREECSGMLRLYPSQARLETEGWRCGERV